MTENLKSNSLVLTRYAYSSTETEGRLDLDGQRIYTIERPWVPGMSLGGKNFESCIPDGDYECEYYVRSNGKDSIRLMNPSLGVYRTKSDRPLSSGRWDCLIHSGNYVEDVVGCIAPGMGRIISQNRRMVPSSGDAVRLIVKAFKDNRFSTLSIRPALGTRTKMVF